MPQVPPSLAERLADVDARIAAAAGRSGRDPGEITRIVVTKFHPAGLVRELRGLGVRDVAENRQQELTAKKSELAALDDSDLDDLRWHFVGQAQTNKARAIRQAASVVHSIDRPRLADAFAAAAAEDDPVLDVLVQVNLTEDAGRGGVEPDSLRALADHVAATHGLRLRGVMAVAPLGGSAAEAFARLARHSALVRTVVPEATWISAGMTGDFEEAVAAGATHLRIGSAITGIRPTRG